MSNGSGGELQKEFEYIDYEQLPPHMKQGMRDYLEEGIPVGGFLHSVLTNDLRGTVKRADTNNRFQLLPWIDFCLGELPGDSWGSSEKVAYWMKFRQKLHRD